MHDHDANINSSPCVQAIKPDAAWCAYFTQSVSLGTVLGTVLVIAQTV